MEPLTPILGIILISVVLAIIFLPAIVAGVRRQRNHLAILVLNLCMFFLGWIMMAVLAWLGFFILFVMWIGMLVWACTSNVEPRTSHLSMRM
jgi:hypothetical protein